MRKKILGAVLLCLICSSFLGASNINQASFTPESNEQDIKVQRGEKESTWAASFVPKQEEFAAAFVESRTRETVSREARTVPSSTNEMNFYKNRWNIYLTGDEIDLLAKIVWVEACGEPGEGQEAVVEVVFNRMCSPDHPDTLYGVLSEGNPTQFSSWRLKDKAKPTEKEYRSIYRVLYGQTNILRNDTMYFSTFAMTSYVDKKICCHYFCYDK